MNDPFRKLPAPILLITMKFIPTLPSLYQLTRASGAAADMFEELPAEILAAVIRPLPKELQRIIGAVALTLSEQCTDPDADSAQQIESVLELLSSKKTMKDIILRDLPLASVMILVDCACHVHQLAATFLECHIKRLNAIQPQHLENPVHYFRWTDPFQNYPKGRAYTPSTSDVPSWVEEYRVVRALWQLQLYHLLKTKYEPAKSKDSYAGGRDPGLLEAWGHRLKEWELDSMECVQDWLTETGLSLYPITETVRPFSLQIPLEEADRRSILNRAPIDEISKAWDQDFDASQSFSRGFSLFHGFGKRVPTSVLKDSEWKTFRRLGFGIWDHKRMVMMELVSGVGERTKPDWTRCMIGFGVKLGIGNICFTWKSIEDQKIA